MVGSRVTPEQLRRIVAIVGSRDFPRLTLIDDRVHRLRDDCLARETPLKIVSGGARGADSRARWACKFWSVDFEEFPADWETGRAAGYNRNVKLVEMADLVVAFWDGESKGTKHTIDLALKMRKALEVHFP